MFELFSKQAWESFSGADMELWGHGASIGTTGAAAGWHQEQSKHPSLQQEGLGPLLGAGLQEELLAVGTGAASWGSQNLQAPTVSQQYLTWHWRSFRAWLISFTAEHFFAIK